MKHKLFLLTLLCPLLFVNGFAQTVTLSEEIKQALETVKASEIKADIAYLADDKLKGRAPGTEGFQMAVDYVVDHLKQLGVRPAGEHGSWLQTVRFRKAFVKEPVFTIKDGQAAVAATQNDLTISPNPVVPEVSVQGALVFAGYGISEPGLGYDDYANLNVKGKVVIVVRGAPEKFASSVSAHVMNGSTILRKAAEHGAVGVIVASVDSTARVFGGGGNGSGGAPRGVNSIMDEKGRVAVSRSYDPGLKVYGTMRYALVKSLFQKAGKSIPATIDQLKAGNPQSFAVPAQISLSYKSVYQDMVSYNVVGKITGSDRKLKKQYVVHSAHLDHLGIGNPVLGDSIFNGAHDNASGVASLLGIAKIYSNIKAKPKRSVLVVLVTGEEMGDLGSGYFAQHPTVPVKSMVADVNTDMPTVIAPLLSITALGAEHSSLAAKVDQAAGYFGITVEPDPEPKQARFTRSDQYSFVVAGIPALHVKYGSKTADGKNNLNDLVAPWRAKYYHKPQDDINGLFDFEAGKTYAQLNFLIGYLVAQDRAKPTWNSGDIFSSGPSGK
ncbi:M28 family peptidase [Hufsiella ginkgonis]|uniref:M28 family peptidase n=1 Tax=Hufsiella ginkgonis TaxID=2695274 RepID=A0A7K1XWH7_9SPHI|nr:M28 family peptidase [Hufsiella ginkgonis]MXV15331.1 M28 family peptidase [Hufsiella ginkgonis]